jgi:hypothetical protein
MTVRREHEVHLILAGRKTLNQIILQLQQFCNLLRIKNAILKKVDIRGRDHSELY